MFNTNWDVDKYKAGYEPEEHWNLRRKFMVAHKERYPEDKLVCLTQVFFNMEFLGCKYPEKTMELVNELADAVAEDFREARKGKLKRTFVGAKDAAGAKAKGGKPPPGVTEGTKNEQQQSKDQAAPYKRSRFDDDGSSGQHYSGGRNEQQQSYNKSRFEDLGSHGQRYSDRYDSTASGSGPPYRKDFQGGGRNEPQQSRDQSRPYKSRFDDDGSSSQQSYNRYDSGSRGSGSYNRAPYNRERQDDDAELREIFKDFVLLIPTRGNSKTEEDPLRIIQQNFSDGMLSYQFTGNKKSEFYTCELKASPVPLNGGQKPQFVIASATAGSQKECKVQVASEAIEKLKRVCTIIEPNPAWFQEGGTPEFISRRIPCSKTPRSYLIMTKKDTGHISPQVADMLMDNLKRSSNEDMFFIDTEYNEKEKRFLLDRCQAHKLGNRHFGSGVQLGEHHVCIYKKRMAQEIIEEARNLGWKHPKWIIRHKNSVN